MATDAIRSSHAVHATNLANKQNHRRNDDNSGTNGTEKLNIMYTSQDRFNTPPRKVHLR
jgi:hypothetical protein